MTTCFIATIETVTELDRGFGLGIQLEQSGRGGDLSDAAFTPEERDYG